MSIEIYSVGDRGITLSIKEDVSLAHQQKIWWLGTEVEKCEVLKRVIVDIVPGMNNLTLFLNPYHVIDHQEIQTILERLWQEADQLDLTEMFQGKLVEVPVIYGGDKGPDLIEVAKMHDLTPEALVSRHTDPIYTVYFVGFMPGFVYLGGLHPSIHTARRATPRLKIPAGSVGIGGSQTGVYPGESPGGWQILGNTDLPFFDMNRAEPSLFLPGDQLRFVAKEILL